MLDYFTDIYRLKPFQDIEHSNVQKIYGYGTYWMLKRHPIQQIASVPSDLVDINEKVMAITLLAKILREANVNIKNDSNLINIVNFYKLIYYNFCFRPYTQQTLELAVDALLTGCKLH